MAQPSASIPAASADLPTLKAAYRLFANHHVQPQAMLASHLHSTQRWMPAMPLVLAVQHTTYRAWTDHPASKDPGPLAAPSDQGLLAHTTLASTPERLPLGLLQQQVWARDPAVRRHHDHKQRPTCEKESQKWLTSLDAVIVARAACPDTHFISVGDREADVYDLFLLERPVGVDLLVRAAQDRKVEPEEQYLWATMATAPVAASVAIHIGQRQGQSARDATLTIRWQAVTLRPPKRRDKQKLPTVTSWAV